MIVNNSNKIDVSKSFLLPSNIKLSLPLRELALIAASGGSEEAFPLIRDCSLYIIIMSKERSNFFLIQQAVGRLLSSIADQHPSNEGLYRILKRVILFQQPS